MAQTNDINNNNENNDNNNSSSNFAADTSNYLQQFQSLTQQANDQQKQFEINQQKSQQLQENLAINNNNNNQLNIDDNNNDNDNDKKDDESKEVTQIEREILTMNIKQKTGIDENTQGHITIHHNNKQLKSNHYQSTRYKDFASMKEILRPGLLFVCFFVPFNCFYFWIY